MKDESKASCPYWTVVYSSGTSVVPDKLVTMANSGALLHGEVNRMTIVRGSPYMEDPSFLNIGNGVVPTGPVNPGTKQETHMPKLLPMVYLEPVDMERLSGCTVEAYQYVHGAQKKRRATVEEVHEDGTVTLAFLPDQTSIVEANLEHTRRSILKDVVRMVESSMRRFRVVKPPMMGDGYQTHDDPHPWLSNSESGEGPSTLARLFAVPTRFAVATSIWTAEWGTSGRARRSRGSRSPKRGSSSHSSILLRSIRSRRSSKAASLDTGEGPRSP